MASDTEDLVLSISADVRQMQRALARITADTAKTTKAIEREFDAAGARTGAAFDQTATRANRAFTVIEGGAARVNRAMAASRFQTANLAAQLNDIGVQLASGTSPFTIAIQQGSQINQVLGTQGVRGTVSLLGGAFTSLINPVSLATIAIITLGGVAVQYFTEFLSNSEKSEGAIKRQNELIREVAKRWGEAVPALQDYLAELDKAKETADALAAGEFIRGDLFEPLKAGAADLAIEMADFVSVLRDAGADTALIDELQASFLALREKIDDNSASTQDTDRAQEALNATMALGFGDATALGEALEVLAGKLRVVAERAAEADRQIAAVTSRSSTGGRARYQPGLIDLPTDVPTPERRPNDIQRLDDEAAFRDRESRRGAGERNRAAREAEREAEAVARLVEQLEFEYSLLGLTDEERQVQIALRKAGAAATDEQKARIEELTIAIDREREALKQSEEAMRQLQSIGKEFIGGFIQDMLNGASATDALANALRRVGDRILDIALNGLFDGGGLFRLLGGGAFPARPLGVGLYHSGGVAGSPLARRSVSPALFAGAPRYHGGGVAGLRPGEVPAILQRGEVILPRNTSSRHQASGPSRTVFEVNVSGARGNTEIMAMVEAGVRRGIEQNNSDVLPSLVSKAVSDPRVSG